ncbi:MAG: WG repeat-containing protein [Bacteroides sp.]|nr:WG repeat-containing protein [Eubacterium sp.]MCM1419722.1 WG repeat-containing protein [Roseburia sp.]MCM1463316.1 WG repeat-containing protein [Bacteroides sp.]
MKKKIKRALSVFLAGIVAASTLTVGASAASSKLKLQTVAISKVEKATDFGSLGDGYYWVENSADPNLTPDLDEIVYIGVDELKKWQEKGKFTYKKIKTDPDMTDMLISGGFTDDGSYMQFQPCDADRNILKRYIVTHDEKNTKLTTAYTKGSDWSWTNPNGYTVEAKWNTAKTKYTVTVTAPDGTEKKKTLTYKGEGEPFVRTIATDSTGKYVAYVLWKTGQYDDNQYTDEDMLQYNRSDSFKIYGVKKNGKFTTLINYEGGQFGRRGAYGYNIDSSGSNYITYWILNPPIAGQSTVYLTDSKKTFTFQNDIYDQGGTYGKFYGITDKVYGTRAIVQLGKYNSETGETESDNYILADLSKTEEYGMLTDFSKVYKHMYTGDGKIYVVENEEGKWGYINRKGKELGFFDSANSFKEGSDYAIVLKNGKAYLVDRNMKQVSEKIDADSINTLDDGLWQITKGDKTYLMTYKK